MNTGATNWAHLEPLLDELLALPPHEREARLAGLENTRPHDAQTLREWLAGIADADSSLLPRAALHDGLVVGAWRLLYLLGQGGMGEVWLCERTDGAFRKTAAIKFIRSNNPLLRKKLETERDLLAQLQHPHIARLLDGGTAADGQPYMVTDYIDGVPLDVWCREQKPSLEQRLEVFRQICAAVSYAHANLIVHRDIKPANVLIDRDGQAHLLDFGISKLLQNDGDARQTTQFALTPDYAAPEQLTGAPITTRTDVYALGGLLYFLLCGKSPLPIRDLPLAAMVKRVCEEIPRAPCTIASISIATGHLAKDLDVIALRALAKAAPDRYATTEALVADVDNASRNRPIHARRANSLYRIGLYLRRHRIGVAIGMMLLLSLLAGFASTLWQAGIANQQRDRLREQARTNQATIDFMVALLASSAPNDEAIKVKDLLASARDRVLKLDLSTDKFSGTIDALTAIYNQSGDSKNTEAFLESLLRDKGSLLPANIYAEAACSLANAKGYLNKLDESKYWNELGLARSASLPKNSDSPHPHCLAIKAGLVRIMDHDLPSSIALQRQAISEIQTDSSESIIDYGKDLAEFKLVLSDNLTLSGDPRAARKEAHEALEILQKIELGSSVDSGEALEKMAKADASLGQPLRADDEQTRANAIKFATIGSSEDTASGLILAAKYKLDLSDPNAALALFDQAQTMIQAHSQFAGPIALAFAIYRGRAFADLGQPQKSLDQFSLAHSLIEQANMPPQYVDSLRISEAESALKAPSNVQTAQAMLAKLSAIENDLRGKGKGGEEFLARTLTDLAEASMHAGDVKQAAVKATEARSIRVQRGDEEDSAPLAYCDVILAEVRRREGQDAAARTLMQNAAQHMETSLGAKHPRTLETRALAAGL